MRVRHALGIFSALNSTEEIIVRLYFSCLGNIGGSIIITNILMTTLEEALLSLIY